MSTDVLQQKVQQLFKFSGIRCKDVKRVELIIHELIVDGTSKLLFITDFDRTLTKFEVTCKTTGEIKRGWSSFEVFRDSNVMSEAYKKEAGDLRDHYYPIETDRSTTVEEKTPLMHEWWTHTVNLFSVHGLRKEGVAKAVALCDVQLRDKCKDLFDLLYNLSVPVLVLSAGIWNAIEELIRQQASLHDNIHIVANKLHFDEDGLCLPGVEGSIVHVFNKGEKSAEMAEEVMRKSHGHNAIVVGDMLADLDVTKVHQGIFGQLLKIGFLNPNMENHLEEYLDSFDIVLTGDPGMEFFIDLVNLLKTADV